ncbi:hypothetical protein Y032_0343g3064 [Ancylostoma ceylanicum]|uniref:Malate/L-lactate dehydrogenase n=1 Tax=Ancylostoma ceylanicum TaxID=53326 RepID=A0A016RYF1_9BILA|nr:hypothetical protein Y032_0343g3064 [Ancylostoma ceylanicum]
MYRFMVDCMKSVGVVESHAGQLADVLIEADVRGHYSHGLNRLDMYIKDCQKKVCKTDGVPKILKERAGTAWVDGLSLLGPVVGNFCMDLAVKKAKETGVGWVCAKGSNHYGIAGWYVMRAMKEGVMAMSFTNTSPIQYPTRASVPALGTNPMAIGVNGTGDDHFLLDMATTTVAIGKVEIAKRRGESVPETWGVEKGGKLSTNPETILGGGGLFPLGGSEVTGGYKGYGLGAMVEIFCGILSGAHWGPHIRKWMSATTEADLGQCFIAVDPEAFAPGFHERMQEFINTMRNLPAFDDKLRVEVAGDAERKHVKLVQDIGGINYHPNQIKNADELAASLNVKKLTVLKEY